MKSNNFLKLLVLFIALGAVFAVFHLTQAADSSATANITFPIAELGNCGSANACKTYCNDLSHVEACMAYGKEHGLISADEAAAGLKLKDVKIGPGGCTGRDACKSYCADAAHTEECAKFAEDHKVLDKDQIQKFRSFQQAIKDGTTPGSCKTKEECETFCSTGANAVVCMKFAKERKLINSDQAAKIEKFQAAIKNGSTPGGCKTKEACETYCSEESNQAECLKFATDNGLLKKEEAEKLKPGNLVGPGGCKSREECAAFCNDETNRQTCLDFAKDHQLLNKSETDRIETAYKTVKEIKSLPSPVIGCIKEKLSAEVVIQIQDGNFTPDETSAKQIRLCMLNFAERNKGPAAPPEDPAIAPPAKPTDPRTEKPPVGNKMTVPANVRECIVKNYGLDYVRKLESGEITNSEEVKFRITKCLEEMKNIRVPQSSDQNQKQTAPPPLKPSSVKEPFKSDQ